MKTSILINFIFLMVFISCDVREDKIVPEDSILASITYPENASILKDSVFVRCDVDNIDLVQKVELYVNGDSTGIIDYTAPFVLPFDSYDYVNGSYNLFIRVYSEMGNWHDSETINVNISNFLVYNKTFGSLSVNETGHSIIQLLDSSFIILGSIEDDVFLMKTNRYGQGMDWEQSFGGSQKDEATHIQATSDGGYIISGTTESYGFGGSDIWIIKTDNSGLIEWNNCFGSAYNESGGQAKETEDGGFVIIGSKSMIGDENNNVWIIRTNSQGDSLWTKTYGGIAFDSGTSILVNDDGGFVILGSTKSYGNGDSDIWLIKTDSFGNEEWSRTYGSGSKDIGQSILTTYDGGHLIGYKIESFGLGGTSIGLLRVDSNGNELWTKTIGGSTAISSSSFQKVSDDQYVMVCSRFNNGNNAYDTYLIKINDSGDILWDKTYGGSNSDYGYSVINTLDSGFAILGSTHNFGNGSKNSSDIWLIKTDSEGFTTGF